MPLDKGQRKRLNRSLRRARKGGRVYIWPVPDKQNVIEPPCLPNWAKRPKKPAKSLVEKTEEDLRKMRRTVRTLLRSYHRMREQDREWYPDEPEYFLPSAMETLADNFRLERAFTALREACQRSMVQRQVLRPCFDHWRFMPGSAGMQAASVHWHALV